MVTVCVICFSQYFALGKKEEGEEEEEKKEEGGRIERRRKSKEEEQKKGQKEKPKSNTRWNWRGRKDVENDGWGAMNQPMVDTQILTHINPSHWTKELSPENEAFLFPQITPGPWSSAWTHSSQNATLKTGGNQCSDVTVRSFQTRAVDQSWLVFCFVSVTSSSRLLLFSHNSYIKIPMLLLCGNVRQ